MFNYTAEFRNFRGAYAHLSREMVNASKVVHTDTWQGVSIANKPEMATHELEEVFFMFPVGTEELNYHRSQIGPNLPWADDHFERDRVSGEPLNPGYTWKQWPWALKADTFRDENGQYNHSYAERYWPKLAGKTDQGELGGTCFDPEYWVSRTEPGKVTDTPHHLAACEQMAEQYRKGEERMGIRYRYGDLNDVVNLLVRNPLTRNAWLPVWFPEDTGVVHGGRTPCTIGYQFRMRDNRLHIFYEIRSCDFYRHFKDDVYLTIRLLLWVLQQCRKKDERWAEVRPGRFSMHIGSLHLFVNDYRTVFS